jgi:hypothetical protein
MDEILNTLSFIFFGFIGFFFAFFFAFAFAAEMPYKWAIGHIVVIGIVLLIMSGIELGLSAVEPIGVGYVLGGFGGFSLGYLVNPDRWSIERGSGPDRSTATPERDESDRKP